MGEDALDEDDGFAGDDEVNALGGEEDGIPLR